MKMIVRMSFAQTGSFRFRDEWWFDFSLIDGNPIGCRKPFMIFDVIDSVLQIAETFGQIDLEKIAENIFQIITEMWWKTNLNKPFSCNQRAQEKIPYFAGNNFFIDLNWLISKEWRITLKKRNQWKFFSSFSIDNLPPTFHRPRRLMPTNLRLYYIPSIRWFPVRDILITTKKKCSLIICRRIELTNLACHITSTFDLNESKFRHFLFFHSFSRIGLLDLL